MKNKEQRYLLNILRCLDHSRLLGPLFLTNFSKIFSTKKDLVFQEHTIATFCAVIIKKHRKIS